MKLDRKQGFGTISGDHHGAVFEQNGRLFDADGEEVIVTETVIDEPVTIVEGEGNTQAPARVIKVRTAVVKVKAAAKAITKSRKKRTVPPVPAVSAPVKKSATSSIDSQLAAQGVGV